MDWIWIWVAVIAVSLVVEVATMEMVSLWTAFGGAIALLLASLNVSIEVQLIVFFAVSITLLLSLRKVAMKYLLKNNKQKTGTDLLIGTSQKLKKAITSESRGSIKINDLEWSATTDNGEEIPEGTLVEIIRIEGNKLIVKRKEN